MKDREEVNFDSGIGDSNPLAAINSISKINSSPSPNLPNFT